MTDSPRRIAAVARETLRQSVRDRTASVITALAAIAIVLSVFLTPLALGEGLRVVIDIGLALTVLAPCGIILVTGVMLFAQETTRRTLLPILATPVTRAEILLGRALGLWTTAILVAAALTAVHLGTLAMVTGRAWWTLLPANLLAVGEITVMVAALTLFSAISTPGLTAVFTGTVFVLGHAASDMLGIAHGLPPVGAWTVRALYGLIPHLEMFNGRSAVVHGSTLAATRLATAGAYAGAYSAGLLSVACLAFRRREVV